MRHWLPALLAAAFSAAAPAQVAGLNVLASGAPGDEVATPQVRLEHQPHWHTYWKNPGDSGLPTKLEWTLPPGVRAGEIQWPLPQRLPLGPLVNYGYEGTVLLPVPLTITPEFEPGPAAEAMEVRLHASWLVCKQECIPQEGDFAIRLPLRGSSALNGAAFEQALGRLPADLPSGGQTATLSSDGQRLQMRISGLPASVQGQPLQWFPETGDIVAAAVSPAREGAALTPATWSQKWEGDVWTASLPVADTRLESPAALPPPMGKAGAPMPKCRASGPPCSRRAACRRKWLPRCKKARPRPLLRLLLRPPLRPPLRLLAQPPCRPACFSLPCWARCWEAWCSISCPACFPCWPSR